MPQSRPLMILERSCLLRMGKAGRRKRDALEYEAFDGAGCSSGLQLELAPNNESGYAGVSGPTTTWRVCEHRTRMPLRVGWSEQAEGLTGRRLVRVLCAGSLARIVTL